MLYQDTVDVPQGIDINKASTSKECDICHDWCFQIKRLSFSWMSVMGVMMH